MTKTKEASVRFAALTVATAILLAGNLQAAQGPFGLAAGMTKAELQEVVGELAPVEDRRQFFRTSTVPNPHSAFATYAVLVGPKSGLCQIHAIGHRISTNRHGVQLESKFEDLRTQIEQVYGKYELTDELLPGSIWDQPEDWMTALRKKERLLLAKWSSETGAEMKDKIESIYLGAQASSDDSGRVSVQYVFQNSDRCKDEIEASERDVL